MTLALAVYFGSELTAMSTPKAVAISAVRMISHFRRQNGRRSSRMLRGSSSDAKRPGSAHGSRFAGGRFCSAARPGSSVSILMERTEAS